MFEIVDPNPADPENNGNREEPFLSSAWPPPAQTPGPAIGPEPARESGRIESAAVKVWKDTLRQEFETWLDSLDEIPHWQPEDDEDDEATPDLFSFFQLLGALNAETRRANRRTAEAFSQWGEILSRFERELTPLRETVAHLTAAQPVPGTLTREQSLFLIELLDRMERVQRAFGSPPARRSWWGGDDAAWRKAWEAQRQGFAILTAHLQEYLRQQGIERIVAVSQPFDPRCMMAVATEQDPSRPPSTVIEELAPGYRRQGEILRVAQVKVTHA